MFITFEGIDGCGKTTQVELLENHLKEKGFSVLVTREPGGTEFAEKCRDLLKNYGDQISPITQAFLISAARRDFYENFLKPNLKKVNYIISDRYIDSFIAYQMFGQKVHPECIKKLEYFSTNKCLPDLTFFLDIEPQTALERIVDRNQKDHFDNEKIDFFEKVRNGYKQLSYREMCYVNHVPYKRFVTIDATNNIRAIHNIVLNSIDDISKLISNNN